MTEHCIWPWGLLLILQIPTVLYNDCLYSERYDKFAIFQIRQHRALLSKQLPHTMLGITFMSARHVENWTLHHTIATVQKTLLFTLHSMTHKCLYIVLRSICENLPNTRLNMLRDTYIILLPIYSEPYGSRITVVKQLILNGTSKGNTLQLRSNQNLFVATTLSIYDSKQSEANSVLCD